jgi:ribA/ribD-fused uncharacterized protein
MIDSFTGPNRFLSNFYPCEVQFEGYLYPTVEHAFQAAKSTNQEVREAIRLAETPSQAKTLGRQVDLRPDWEEVKLDIMLGLLREKFSSPFMKRRLLLTGDRTLIEGNTWGDTYWGVYRTKGENHLGRLLMQVREELGTDA